MSLSVVSEQRNIPLWLHGSDELHQRQLQHLRDLRLSDPVGIPMYTDRGGGKPVKGRRLGPLCARGTGMSESSHGHEVAEITSVGTMGVLLSDGKMTHLTDVDNCKAAIRNRGAPDLGHFDNWVNADIKRNYDWLGLPDPEPGFLVYDVDLEPTEKFGADALGYSPPAALPPAAPPSVAGSSSQPPPPAAHTPIAIVPEPGNGLPQAEDSLSRDSWASQCSAIERAHFELQQAAAESGETSAAVPAGLMTMSAQGTRAASAVASASTSAAPSILGQGISLADVAASLGSTSAQGAAAGVLASLVSTSAQDGANAAVPASLVSTSAQGGATATVPVSLASTAAASSDPAPSISGQSVAAAVAAILASNSSSAEDAAANLASNSAQGAAANLALNSAQGAASGAASLPAALLDGVGVATGPFTAVGRSAQHLPRVSAHSLSVLTENQRAHAAWQDYGPIDVHDHDDLQLALSLFTDPRLTFAGPRIRLQTVQDEWNRLFAVKHLNFGLPRHMVTMPHVIDFSTWHYSESMRRQAMQGAAYQQLGVLNHTPIAHMPVRMQAPNPVPAPRPRRPPNDDEDDDTGDAEPPRRRVRQRAVQKCRKCKVHGRPDVTGGRHHSRVCPWQTCVCRDPDGGCARVQADRDRFKQ